MKKLCLLALFVWGMVTPSGLWAKSIDEELTEIASQIAEIERSLAPLQKETTNLSNKLASLKSGISRTEKAVADVGAKLIDKESDLEVRKVLMMERIKRWYINQKRVPMFYFLAMQRSEEVAREMEWYQRILANDRREITKYLTEINELSGQKVKLEQEKEKLKIARIEAEKRVGFLSGEIAKAEAYKQELSQRQQKLLAEKLAMFSTSVGEAGTSDDPAARADYNPGFSPAFAVFSFGAPHRKGMSQYGALGRAKAGQNYETILRAYYGGVRTEKVEMPGSIKTTIGSLPFEDNYLLGIAEMPARWGDEGGFEALKAQAVAARTYALYSTGWRKNGGRSSSGTICVTEACQVYNRSRAANPGTWKRAVEETRGQVLVDEGSGEIFSTMYASTAGGATYGYSSEGHSTPQRWDTKCGDQGCWPGEAWEKEAKSPWYYKGWYRLRSGSACGRSHPWLNQEEMADIVNALIYFKKTGDSSHLSQYDTGGCFGGKDPSAWDREELKRQVIDKGGAVTAINSISVDYSTGGYVKQVRISTNQGEVAVEGEVFKQIFTLRAPGAISVKSALFNIERK